MTKTTLMRSAALPHAVSAPPMPEPDAFGIDEFCRRHGLCRATFYNLQSAGRAPRTMKVGARVLISREAAADWRRQMEAETAQAA